MKTIENLKTLARENSNHLLSLQCNLDVIKSLEVQIAWMQESFESVDYQKESVNTYFREWRTNLLVIHTLFNHIMNEVQQDFTNLSYLNEGFSEVLKEKADALTSAK